MKCGMEIQDKWTVCPQCAEPLPCRAAARPAPPPPRPAVPPPRPATAPPSVPRAQKPGVSVASVIVCSLVLGLGLLSVFHRTSRRTEDPANRSAEDPVAIQNRILAGSHDGYLKALNGKSPVASPPPVATSTSAGEYVIVYKPWPWIVKGCPFRNHQVGRKERHARNGHCDGQNRLRTLDPRNPDQDSGYRNYVIEGSHRQDGRSGQQRPVRVIKVLWIFGPGMLGAFGSCPIKRFLSKRVVFHGRYHTSLGSVCHATGPSDDGTFVGGQLF